MRRRDVFVTAAVSLVVSLAVRGLSPTYRISMGPGGWVSFRGRRPFRVTVPRRRASRLHARRRAS